jgi:hypothetical protein
VNNHFIIYLSSDPNQTYSILSLKYRLLLALLLTLLVFCSQTIFGQPGQTTTPTGTQGKTFAGN